MWRKNGFKSKIFFYSIDRYLILSTRRAAFILSIPVAATISSAFVYVPTFFWKSENIRQLFVGRAFVRHNPLTADYVPKVIMEMSRNASAVTITTSKPLGSKNRIWHFQNWEIRPLSGDYKCLKTPPRPYPRQMPPRLFHIWYPSGCGRRLLRLLRQFFS